MIRNKDLENFYTKIDSFIKLAAIFSEYKELYKIIKMCRLKPYFIFNSEYQRKTKYENHWVDEFGNSLKIEKNKLEIIFDDNVLENTKTITDLFYGRSIKFILKESNYYFSYNNIISFIGKDDYIRCFIAEDYWKRITPLKLGIDNLILIARDKNIIKLPDNKLNNDIIEMEKMF